jgi:malonyl-CoA O-methyltransferase
VHRFIDMHDIGDALVRAGLAEPVMDTERLTITYPTLPALVEELRASGSTNIARGRARGLTGKRRAQNFQAVGRNGALAVSVEAVYGHAWAGTVREQKTEGEVRVPLTAIRPRRS